MKFRRFYAIFRKEGVHIVRDWRSLGLALAIPAMLLLLFGYALTLDVDKIPTAVYDQDRTPQSRELIAHFQGSRYFTISDLNATYSSMEKSINKSSIIVGMVIPRDFGRTILSNGAAKVQLILMARTRTPPLLRSATPALSWLRTRAKSATVRSRFEGRPRSSCPSMYACECCTTRSLNQRTSSSPG